MHLCYYLFYSQLMKYKPDSYLSLLFMRSCKGQYSLEVPEDAESVDAVFIIKRQMKYQIKFDDPTVLSIDVPLWFYFILDFCSVNIFHS